MAEPKLDRVSCGIIRTNPKLTGNVKLLSNGNDLYLESFSANLALSSSKFKAFKLDGTSTYDKDVFNFFRKGTLPTDLAYEVFQEFKDTDVLDSYDNQYESFYSSGTRAINSSAYVEDLGMLAPIWLDKTIPNYFVIFKVENPHAVNPYMSKDLSYDDVQTSKNFNKYILENCTAIKTFDLTENSKLGSYLRRYVNQEAFPKAPLTASFRKDEPFTWNGISYFNGGFTSVGNFSYDQLVTNDSTIIENEYYFTQGFQRNGVLLANLINLEFLFSDQSSDNYTMNRYFGLYVDEVNEGTFKLSGSGFYSNTEKTQIPKIKTINEVSNLLNRSFYIQNKNGVVLYLDEDSIETTTGYPTHKRVNEVESIFFVKDKNNQFHTIKKGSTWNTNQLRLFDKNIDVSVFTGFSKPTTFMAAQLLNGYGKATAYIKVLEELPVGSTITFYDGDNQIGQISANTSLTSGPGTSFERFFNPTGTTKEIARAIVAAIQFGISKDDRLFDATINDSVVYLQSRFSGSRFNSLSFTLNYTEYPELQDALVTYPQTEEFNESAAYVGGADRGSSLVLIGIDDKERFNKGDYVMTSSGYAMISDWVPYLNEPIISNNGTQIGYKNIDKYVICVVLGDNIKISRSEQLAIYSDFSPSFGRFSIYPVKDFDFDFYSERYSNLGELNYEISKYNQNTDISNTGVTGYSYSGVSGWPDIRSFYEDGGFSNLIGIVKSSGADFSYDLSIKSEYQRLEENFLKEQAIASRITPYINKWCWFDDGTDVRNNPYRLNLSLAFGLNNFAPSKWESGRSTLGFSHEWYYLSMFPSYFDADAITESWSYFDKVPTDNTVTTDEFIPGTFQRTDINMFNEYFIVDRFNLNSNIHLIDRQLRYGRFSGGDSKNYAECFLRGVRVIAKNKKNINDKANFNAKKLAYINDGSFNDYRFSVMVVPNAETNTKTKIKIIKNDKWKTVVMLIFISINNECLTNTSNSIDRTSLYALNNSIETTTDCTKIDPIEYKDSVMKGSINFMASGWSTQAGQWLIQGASDINGLTTSFLTDITIGVNGKYNPIEFTVNGDVYRIDGISKILSNSQLYATSVTKNGNNITLPSFSLNSNELKTAVYFIKGVGYKKYTNVLDNIGFSNIFNAINIGDPNIIYETINESGDRVLSDDGSLAQTFMIELRAQDDILKSIYLDIKPDPNKPTIFSLADIIGYDLSVQKTPSIVPIARHSGWYKPLTNNIFFFRDPYANTNFDDIITGTTGNTGTGSTGGDDDMQYKWSVYNLCKYKNTQFFSAHNMFGVVQNLFYHKVNQEDPARILELSTTSPFRSLYPLINEVGISYRDFYVFSSNWDPYYFIKSIDKSKIQYVDGIESMKEKTSFFGSKYLKVPQQISIEKFTPSVYNADAIKDTSLVKGTFMYKENQTYVEFYMFIQKNLTEYLFSYIKPQFQRYFGYNDVDRDVIEYIEQNILGLYMIKNVDFYVKSSREKIATNYDTAMLSNTEKINSGLNIDNNTSTKILNTNQFDLSLIYNKRSGFSDSYGFSVTLVKK